MPKKIVNTLFGEEEVDVGLTEHFGAPPFSIFDTKQGYWQDRKRWWLSMGIKSELGRGDNLTITLACFSYEDEKLRRQEIKNNLGKCLPEGWDEEKYGRKMKAQATSVFDPVICELSYKWFNVKGGFIYDPFAGGSVRGIVAEKLGYKYLGIDLSEDQIEANRINAKELDVEPEWFCDDSLNVNKYVRDDSVDMIFTCPPYFDLEVYSDKKNDLSNMTYEEFRNVYIEIIKRATKKLKNNRFAVIIVGDMRDKDGYYRNFVDLTKYAFHKGGMKLWNEIILLNALGTSMLRCIAPFNANRKMTKVHQNVLVFYKGDPKKIRENYKEIEGKNGYTSNDTNIDNGEDIYEGVIEDEVVEE